MYHFEQCQWKGLQPSAMHVRDARFESIIDNTNLYIPIPIPIYIIYKCIIDSGIAPIKKYSFIEPYVSVYVKTVTHCQ